MDLETPIEEATNENLKLALRLLVSQGDIVYGQSAMIIGQETADRMRENNLREIERVLRGE